MSLRLCGLTMDSYRTFGGSEVQLPLDADVVLVYGGNASGKTSLISAIELGLTGVSVRAATSPDLSFTSTPLPGLIS